jgi:hypothetical protein
MKWPPDIAQMRSDGHVFSLPAFSGKGAARRIDRL